MGGRHRRQPPRRRAWRRRRGHRRIRKVRGELLANAGPREFSGTRGRRRRPTRLVPPPRQGVIRAGGGAADGGGRPRMPSPAPRVERSTRPARGDGRRRSGPALEPPARRTKSWRTLITRRCGSGVAGTRGRTTNQLINCAAYDKWSHSARRFRTGPALFQRHPSLQLLHLS